MSDILKVRMSSDPAGCVLCGVLWRPESSDIWGPSLTSLQNLPVKVRTVLTLLYVYSEIWGPSLTSLQNLPVKVRTGLTLLLYICIYSDIWGSSLTSLQNLPVRVRTGLTQLLYSVYIQ